MTCQASLTSCFSSLQTLIGECWRCRHRHSSGLKRPGLERCSRTPRPAASIPRPLLDALDRIAATPAVRTRSSRRRSAAARPQLRSSRHCSACLWRRRGRRWRRTAGPPGPRRRNSHPGHASPAGAAETWLEGRRCSQVEVSMPTLLVNSTRLASPHPTVGLLSGLKVGVRPVDPSADVRQRAVQVGGRLVPLLLVGPVCLLVDALPSAAQRLCVALQLGKLLLQGGPGGPDLGHRRRHLGVVYCNDHRLPSLLLSDLARLVRAGGVSLALQHCAADALQRLTELGVVRGPVPVEALEARGGPPLPCAKERLHLRVQLLQAPLHDRHKRADARGQLGHHLFVDVLADLSSGHSPCLPSKNLRDGTTGTISAQQAPVQHGLTRQTVCYLSSGGSYELRSRLQGTR